MSGLFCGLNEGRAGAPPGPWESRPGYRVRALDVSGSGKTGFTTITPKNSGVWFTNIVSGEAIARDGTLLGGSGVALGDIDGDGWCDIYFCSLSGRNALYHNLGNWQFEEIAESAGVACPGQVSRGAVFADVNGDGSLDLLVTTRGGGVRLFLNDGRGKFHESTVEAGLSSRSGSTSLALADVDGNGTLDLYVANFGVESVLRSGGTVSTTMVNGKLTVMGRWAKKIKVIDGQLVEFGEPDALYLNDGKGRFTQVPWDQGAFLDEKGKPVEAPWDYGLSVQMRDLNGDGWPDIYVCNDFFTPDRIWINDGRGRFRAIDTLAIRKTSYASMGVDFADIDRTGHMDGFIVEMLARDPALRLREMTPDLPSPPVIGGLDRRPQTGRNTLLLNRGDGTFAEIANFAGVAASDWSWMPLFLDVDLDGFEDLLISTGPTFDLLDLDTVRKDKVRDARVSGHSAFDFPRRATPNCAFRNRGNLTFSECGQEWGFDSARACNGMALADLDNDGDLDIVINCLNAGALLLRNDTAAPRLAVRLKGLAPNVQGIGAMVVVRGGAVETQSQEIISGGRFLSGDEPTRVFAAGSLTNRMSIEVNWRGGKRSLVENALPNHFYEIDEAAAEERSRTVTASAQPLFNDVTEALRHAHHQEPFNDLERQPLLPKRLSQLGPGVAWHDVGGEGTDELIIGNGKNQMLSIYRWQSDGRFVPLALAAGGKLSGDSSGLAAFALRGRPALIVAQSSYEIPTAPPLSLLFAEDLSRAGLSSASGPGALSRTSIGPVAAGDIDGDGELEVFAGGRVIPGRYPEAAPSFLLRFRDGAFVVDTNLSAELGQVGLVSGAVFSDLSGTGRPDLVLACDWGPVRVFSWADGHLRERTAELGLDRFTGLWQSVTTGDFDGDGRMDIVAGNWGLNSRWQAEPRPLTLFYGEFCGDGGVQILEASYDATGANLIAGRDWQTLAAGMPFLLNRFASNRPFSQAGVEAILGEAMSRARKLQAATLESTLFLNRGSHFEARALPAEVQWAPGFGLCVADFDGDGFEDLFLAQNFFGTISEGWRQDAGRGLLLKGDGHGGFLAVPGQESGITIYGEQRGCAAGDYDGDGRVDLVVAQNGEATRLYHNVGAKPGVRIRLRGPAENPQGIGAVLRTDNDGQLGPARELHAGSGYWSQDSLTQVMALGPGSRLEVRWPGGKTTRLTVPSQARTVQVNYDGTVGP